MRRLTRCVIPILGIIFGCVGPWLNSLVLRTRDIAFQRFHGGEIKNMGAMGGAIGARAVFWAD